MGHDPVLLLSVLGGGCGVRDACDRQLHPRTVQPSVSDIYCWNLAFLPSKMENIGYFVIVT